MDRYNHLDYNTVDDSWNRAISFSSRINYGLYEVISSTSMEIGQ